ncbi:MAG: ATP-binding protein [Spirochaetaceae bacterium]|nr:ATP-binding protein [Spirochaetaceae bacterium]
MKNMTEIEINGASPLFSTEGLQFQEFPSDFTKIRYYTLMLISSAPFCIRETNLLEQQVSELVKNGITHGNKNDPRKLLKIWYSFTHEAARLIVEDEGEGFNEIPEWNEFNKHRLEYLQERNNDKLMQYISFRSHGSDEKDGGNALFAALEYWNAGLVFNEKHNAVAAERLFLDQNEELRNFKPWDIDSDRPVLA